MPTAANESSNVPRSLHMMQHVFRSKKYFSVGKSISNTDTALIITQHLVLFCLEGIKCKRQLNVNPKIGQLQHYRKSCPMGKKFVLEKCDKNTKNPVLDTGVWRYLETVIENSKIALENIKFS